MEINHDLIQKYIAAYNAKNVEEMLATLSPDIHFINRSGGVITMELKGKEAFQKQAGYAAQLFESRLQEIVSLTAESENCIRIDIRWTGTLAADIPGLGEKGQMLELKGQSVFCFANGMIVSLEDIS